jgi:uncharacterized protein (TIGR02679 family)
LTPSPEALARLRQLLGAAELAALRQRLRRIYAQQVAEENTPPLPGQAGDGGRAAEPAAEPGMEPAPVRLTGLQAFEAEALQALSGRAPRAVGSLTLDLAALSLRLQAAGLADGLRQALEALDGPITSRHELAQAAAAWPALAQEAPHPALRAWLAQAPALGLLKRLAGGSPQAAQRLCERASRVLGELPAAGQPRAQLAAQLLGNAHALDDGQAVATLVLAVLRASAAEGDAENTRALWASQGVAVNELARPALALNLPGAGVAATPGEPQYWPLRRLLRRPPAWQVAGLDLFVCENPNLLALAADALGARCAPLLCTEGMPAAAQRTLLLQLRAAGARLRYHGDFDWPGIAIGNQLMQTFGAGAWRFGSDDYQAALHASSTAERAALQGREVAACWDATLAPAMAKAGCALPEEAVFETLLEDLSAR